MRPSWNSCRCASIYWGSTINYINPSSYLTIRIKNCRLLTGLQFLLQTLLWQRWRAQCHKKKHTIYVCASIFLKLGPRFCWLVIYYHSQISITSFSVPACSRTVKHNQWQLRRYTEDENILVHHVRLLHWRGLKQARTSSRWFDNNNDSVSEVSGHMQSSWSSSCAKWRTRWSFRHHQWHSRSILCRWFGIETPRWSVDGSSMDPVFTLSQTAAILTAGESGVENGSTVS